MFFDNWSQALNFIIKLIEYVLNTIGIIIIMRSVFYGLRAHFLHNQFSRHYICRGISTALNYNLAVETLKIIVGCDIRDLMIIGSILLLKLLITILFIVELKHDELQIKHLKDFEKNKKYLK